MRKRPTGHLADRISPGGASPNLAPAPGAKREQVEAPMDYCIDGALGRLFDGLRAIRLLLEGKRKGHLTVEEVAGLVGRAPYTVRHWITSGRLKATRVAGTGPKGRLLVAREEL